MTGIREKKKKLARENILESAMGIFEEKGFDKASVGEIAKRANLGVGTVYNYFKSKDDIFVESFASQFEIDEEFKFDIKDLLEKSISDIISEYVKSFFKPCKYIPKSLLRELFRITAGIKNNKNLILKLAEIDFNMMDKVEDVLDSLKEKKIFSESFDSRIVSEMIYQIYAYEFLMWIYMDDFTFEELFEKAYVKVEFLFKDKVIKR